MTLAIERALYSARLLADKDPPKKTGKGKRDGREFTFAPAAEYMRVARTVLPLAGLMLRPLDAVVCPEGLTRTYRLTHDATGLSEEWSTTTPMDRSVRQDLAAVWARTHSLVAVVKDLLWPDEEDVPDTSEAPVADDPVALEDKRRAARAAAAPDRNNRGEPGPVSMVMPSTDELKGSAKWQAMQREAEWRANAAALRPETPAPTADDLPSFPPRGATDPVTEVVARPDTFTAESESPQRNEAPRTDSAPVTGTSSVTEHSPASPPLLTDGDKGEEEALRAEMLASAKCDAKTFADCEHVCDSGMCDPANGMPCYVCEAHGAPVSTASPSLRTTRLLDEAGVPHAPGRCPVRFDDGIPGPRARDAGQCVLDAGHEGAHTTTVVADHEGPPFGPTPCGYVRHPKHPRTCGCWATAERCAECDSVLVDGDCIDRYCPNYGKGDGVDRDKPESPLASPSPSQVSLVSKAASRVGSSLNPRKSARLPEERESEREKSLPASWDPGAAWLKCPKKKARTNKGPCKAKGCGKDVEPGEKYRDGMPVPKDGRVVKRLGGKPEGVMHEKCLASLMAESLPAVVVEGEVTRG